MSELSNLAFKSLLIPIIFIITCIILFIIACIILFIPEIVYFSINPKITINIDGGIIENNDNNENNNAEIKKGTTTIKRGAISEWVKSNNTDLIGLDMAIAIIGVILSVGGICVYKIKKI